MDTIKSFLPMCLFLQQQTPTIVTIVTSTKHPPATPTKRKMYFSANDDIVYIKNILELNENNQNNATKIIADMYFSQHHHPQHCAKVLSHPSFLQILLPRIHTFYFLKWS